MSTLAIDARDAARVDSNRSDRARPLACEHCGAPVRTRDARFCCSGCEHVNALIVEGGLARYYDLRNGAGQAVDDAQRRPDDKWASLVEAELRTRSGLSLLALDVDGLHCAGCVWLLEELFRRSDADGRIVVNPARGSADLWVLADFPLAKLVEDAAALGYRFGPRKKGELGSSSLILRMGICIALAMNAMIFAISMYAGLEAGPLARLFHFLCFGLALASFAVGGTVFVRGAWRALRRGMLHLDLPIALGILLGYAGSTVSLFASGGRDSYFDTLTVFIALMLVGRFLRERVLERNRSQLLEDVGPSTLLVRRVTAVDGEGERIEIVSATEVRAGDRLLVAPGDVVPTCARLESPEGTISLDWITGEAEPKRLARGEAVVAGAANAGSSAVEVVATGTLDASGILDLLRVPRATDRYGDVATPFEARLSKMWVILVLAAATAGAAGWLAVTGEPQLALGVAVGVLVVTCPCAFGIATPIAHELVLGGLRQAGLLVRSSSFLERARAVKKVVFDKTGTLTTGALRLADERTIACLDAESLRLLFNLAARSSHPKSAAVRAAIPAGAQRFEPGLIVEEHPGLGLLLEHGGRTYRLGAPAWAVGNEVEGDIAFSVDRQPLFVEETIEELRPEAERDVAWLTEEGFEVWMLTGDRRERACAVAARVGIPEQRVLFEKSPDEKAALLRTIDHGDTLMIGDGLNDSLAVRIATCSGTPGAGRTFLAARTDFYLLGAGLAAVRAALSGAKALRRALGRNLAFAALYNVGAVGLAWAGLMSPLLCAVLMPLSSLTSIALVLRALGRKDAPWKSSFSKSS
jgi:P-type Cu2+ transporter